MRFAVFAIAAVLAVTGSFDVLTTAVEAKSSRSSSPSARRSPGSRSGGGGRSSGGRGRGGPAPTSRRRAYEEEEEDEEDFGDFGFPDEEEEEEEDVDEGYDSDARYDDEEDLPPPPRPSRGGRGGPPPRKGGGGGGGGSRSRGPPPRRPRYEEDEYDAYDMEDEYEERRPSRGGRGGPPPRGRGGPPPRGSGRGGRSSGSGGGRRSGGGRGGGPGGGGRVVVRGRGRPQPQPGAFTRGLTALRESIPDPTAVKDAAFAAASAARETTSKLSANVYREVKGLTSSELEQVMLKATKPDDTPVKGKHVERLVGVTYQISGRYDIYDAVLRKLWAKMTEKDWRTKTKALYILHRFSSDGAPDHQAALKARLRELRRTRDPKRKEKYFNSKQLLGGDATAESAKYRAFLARYAHYVLLRAQCFGGMFNEISEDPSKTPSGGGGGGGKKGGGSGSRSPPRKPATSSALRPEHLEAAQMILKAGCACALKDGEACENTAFCVERVAADLVGLVGAVASALNRSLKNADGPRDGSDPAVLAQWCEFYADELLPKAKRMIKETSPQLDAYGLFLPSRMGASVPQELLQRGLKGAAEAEEEEPAAAAEEEEEEESPAKAGEEEAEEEEEEEEKVVAPKKRAEEPSAPKKKAAPAPRKPEPEPEEEEEEEDEYDEYEYEEEEYYDDEDA